MTAAAPLQGLQQDAVRTTCPYCGVGCGLLVSVADDGSVSVRGDPEHPANFGRLCSKGAALGETVGLEERLLYPEVDGERVSWDVALDAVSERFARVIREHGRDAVAFYVSGQLLTEDYYVANKLMKGFIGSANIDTNSRLCMSSAVAAYKRAFGSDSVPNGYQDIEDAELVVLVGSNLAWCHPVLYQRLLAARLNNPGLRVVVIDPRRTATCDAADLHLALRPGSDAFLFSGLLNWLHERGATDREFVGRHSEGLDDALRLARWYAPDAAAVAAHCELAVGDVERFFQAFLGTERVVTMFSQGINQSSSGTDKGNAIINCHLLTGRIGRPGMGPFSITGQPNAMGGREVGGLANQLAAHMDLDNPHDRDRVARFWQSGSVAAKAGLKAVELFQAVERGEVRALWIMATNPAVSLPDSAQVQRALRNCECLVVSDCVVDTDTLQHAQIRLPALAWGEKSGTVTNSERRISRQRPFLPAPGEARPDWWIVCEVARRLGYAGFDYPGPAAVFDEHARLSAFENDGSRDFDLAGLVGFDDRAYESMAPRQWPCRSAGDDTPRLFADRRFFTSTGRARFVAVTPRPPGTACDPAYPLVLNTGRVRDHWHTLTRTSRSPRLSGHRSEPFVAVSPADAATLGLGDGALAKVSSRRGQVVVRVEVSDGQRSGEVFVPMHWNDRFASQARAGSLVHALVDPVSGQPEFKHTPVRVDVWQPAWHGFLLTRRPVELDLPTYWSKWQREAAWHYELAGDELPADWAGYIRRLLDDDAENVEWRELSDSTLANYRAARIAGGRLDAVLIVQPGRDLPPRDWLAALFAKDRLDDADRRHLLRGVPPGGQQDPGRVVCSCFGVGINTLTRAIREQGLDTAEALGQALGAGTNCGSCVSELRRLIADTQLAQGA